MSSTQTDAALLRGLLTNVLALYVSHPDQLKCDEFHPSAGLLVFQLQTEPTDYPKVLGRQANSLRSLQHIFREIGESIGVHVDVRLMKTPRLPHPEPATLPRDDSAEFDGQPVQLVLEAILSLVCRTPVSVEFKNSMGITAFIAHTQVPVSLLMRDSLGVLIDLFGGKVRRKFYLEIS